MQNIVLLDTVRLTVMLCFFVIFCFFGYKNTDAQSATNPDNIKPAINFTNCQKRGVLTREGLKTTSLINNEIHCYEIILENNQYAHFLIQQEGIDVFLQLFDEKGIPVSPKINSPNDKTGPEPVAVISNEKRKFVLGIASEDKQVQKANYSIETDEFRAAKPSDIEYSAAEPLIYQGYVEARLGKYLNAIEPLAKAWEKLANLTDLSLSQNKVKLRLLDSLAVMQTNVGNYKQARYYLELLRDHPGSKDKFFEFKTSLTLGSIYRQTNEPEKALTENQNAEKILPDLSYMLNPQQTAELNLEIQIRILLSKGDYYWFQMPDFVKAEQHYKQAAQLNINRKDFNNAADIWAIMGAYYFNNGLKTKAEEYYQKSINLKEAKDSGIKGFASQNLAVLYLSEGKFQDALTNFDKAKEYYAEDAKTPEKKDYSEEASAYILHGIANTYIRSGRLDRAFDYIRQAFAVSEPSGKVAFPDAAAFEHLYLGTIYYKQRKKDLADKEFETAISLWDAILRGEGCRKSSNECKVADLGRAYATNNIGQLFYENGEREKALQYFKIANKIQTDINVSYGQIYTLINIGKVELDFSNFDKAKENFDKALDLSQKAIDRPAEVSALFELARWSYKTGALEESEKYLARAKELNENLRVAIEDEELRSSYFSTTSHLYELYVDVLMKLDKKFPNQGYVEKALEVSDSSKARLLSDILSAAKINVRQNIDAALITREKEFQNQVALLIAQKRLMIDLPKSDEIKKQNLDSEITLALENLQKHKVKIRNSDPKFAELSNPRPLKIGEIQKELPSDTLVLEFSVGASNGYVWTVSSSEKVQGYVLPAGRKELGKITRKLVDNIKYQEPLKLIDEKKYDEYKKITRELSNIIFQPLAEKLNKYERLLIITDESLQYVPLNGLPSPAKAEWQPLVVEHEINTIPSMAAFVALQTLVNQRVKTPPNLMLGFIDPEYEPRDDDCKGTESIQDGNLGNKLPLKNLGFGKTLLQNLEKTVGQSKQRGTSKFYKCWEVNRQNATGKDNENYRYILYYAHGKADDSDPASSGIYLSQYNQKNEPQNDYFLGINDIYNLRLSADTVFLSACETALGEEIKGEGLVGITRGFMYAGASSVISSLWKAKEYRTRILVERFFKKVLAEEQSPNSALNQVQKEMWREKLPPYYWAAFQFQGIPTAKAARPNSLSK